MSMPMYMSMTLVKVVIWIMIMILLVMVLVLVLVVQEVCVHQVLSFRGLNCYLQRIYQAMRNYTLK